MDEKDAEELPPPVRFTIVGIVTSEDFQKCRFAITKLHKSFPKEFTTPDIRPMLDVEWNEFIIKYCRRLGNGLWSIKNRVVVFKNDEFLGDFNDLNEFIWKKWKYVFNQDWYKLASDHLIEYLESKTEQCRQLVYLTIAINSQVIGSLLFELYSDIVPVACENFINRCNNGYAGAPIHRIVKNSWIQCGGYDLEPVPMRCENYVVPHNRRGVLSTCNNGPHKDNSTQFYVTLDAAPWMDYKYVAFGQLLHGDDVLKKISDVPTHYQAPTSDIRIVKCGEYKIRPKEDDESGLLYTSDEIEQWKDVQLQMDILDYLKVYHQVIGPEDQLYQVFQPLHMMGSADSVVIKEKMKTGLYSLTSDCKSHTPFEQLPISESDEGDEDYNICGPSHPIVTFKNNLCDFEPTPPSSDMTL